MSGATGVLAGAAVAGAATSAYGISQAGKAQSAAAEAAKNSKVDINALDAQTRAIALKNANDSRALQAQLTPEVQPLQTYSNLSVLSGLGGYDQQNKAANQLAGRMSQPVSNASFTANTPLLNDAIAKARSDLALGGQLSLDQRNEATRRGAAMAGSVGGGNNLGLGRDLSARDLGLTSYNVEQQRLQNAQQFGNLELGQNQLGLGAANFNLNRDVANSSNYLNQFGLLNSYYNNLRQQDLAAASYAQGIPAPVVGLDPSAVANVTVGNQNNQTQASMNAANIRAQQGQNLTGFGGQLIGYGIMGGFGGAGAGNTGMAQAGNYTVPTGSSTAPVFCWVAREVYGETAPEWTQFRDWLLSKGNTEFRDFYIKHGEAIAAKIKGDNEIKTLIRHLMNAAKTN